MNFNDLLTKASIDPSSVLVYRHRPFEPKLRRILPWLAGNRPDLFNAYQRSQGPKAEKAMTKAEYVAAFVGDDAGRTIFVNLYKREGWRRLTREELFAIPENQELVKLGMGA